jgi:hypothetical protein
VTKVTQRNSDRVDQLSMDAPMLPTNRPPTKREVWDRYSYIYGEIKGEDELRRFCRDAWAWHYVSWFNFKAWRKHPDWVDGDAVIYDALPREPFPPDQGFWNREVERLFQVAKTAKAVTSERRAA